MNVVRYLDSFVDRVYMCIVMDYCERGDFQKRIKKAKLNKQCFSKSQILDWFVQLSLGLLHIH